MALPTYSTGTVSIDANGAVTVAGGIWSGLNVVAGDDISVDGGATVLISDVTDVSHAQLAGWAIGAVSDKAYVVYQNSSQRFDDVQIALDLKKQVQALNTTGFEVFVAESLTAPDPSIGDDGQYAFQPSSGKRWRKEGGLWIYIGISDSAFTRYDIAIDVPSRPGSGSVLGKWVAPSLVTFRAGLSESQANADVAANAETVFSLKKNGAEFATITFAAAATTATFACASDTDFEAGDVLTLVAPSPRDDTLADIAFTIVGFR